jgi:hypothetical protein
MKIAICGSMAFAKEMLEAQKDLGILGHSVEVPCDTDLVASGTHDPDNFVDDHKHCTENDIIRKCFKNVEQSDAILVLNHDKNGVAGYVGASTFAEIMFAYHLKKKIFLLNKPPGTDKLRYSHEIGIMQPLVIDGDLNKIK